MKTTNRWVMGAALGVASAMPAFCAAADDTGQAPADSPRAQMREHCKADPEKCKEQMQQMKAKADAWWKKVDTDGDGKISRDEANANAPRVAKDFDKIDTDHDGTISRDELRAAARERRRERGGGGQQGGAEPKPQ
jgi:Ca2+-binding EF-hand superfamily protein